MGAIFSSDGLMPHGHCYLWKPGLVWLHVTSDSLIFLAYVLIPITLIYFIRHRRDIPFNWMFGCFGMFIISCGATHLMAVWTLWYPTYWLSGAIKLVTAVASLGTAGLLIPLIPKALSLPSPTQARRMLLAVEESAARFRAAAEARQDAFFLLEACRGASGYIDDFRYSYVNALGLAMLSETVHGDLSGQRLSRCGPKVARLALHDKCAQVLDQVSPIEEEICVSEAGAEPCWMQVQIVPLMPNGVAVSLRDITQRCLRDAAIQRAEERFRGLLESAPDPMVIVDVTGSIVFANLQTANLFGYQFNELRGRPVELLLPLSAREHHAELRAGYARDPRARAMGSGLELHGRRKDGSEFPVEISLSPLMTETGMLVSSAIRDVSARRAMEASLKLANQELEAFSYSVAHDLRAPLRGMSSFARILLDDHSNALDPDGLDCLQEIIQNAEHMSQLIDALLGLSRVTRVELHPEPVDISALAQRTLSELTAAEPQHAVRVHIQPGLQANLDPTLAVALISNLLGNAWKFSHKVSEPRIDVGVEQRDGTATLFVRDNGAGFDMSYATKLFSPFQRMHPSTDYPGTGIGLATVQRIVRRHGGRVWADSCVGQGATFYLRLPSMSAGAPS